MCAVKCATARSGSPKHHASAIFASNNVQDYATKLLYKAIGSHIKSTKIPLNMKETVDKKSSEIVIISGQVSTKYLENGEFLK